MTRDVDAIRADLAARTVGGMASSAADRDIAALLGVIDGLKAQRDHLLRICDMQGAYVMVYAIRAALKDERR